MRAAVSGFRPEMIDSGVAASSSELFARLVARGGLYSMSNTLIVILAAFLLAAGMEVSGALDRILAVLLRGGRAQPPAMSELA